MALELPTGGDFYSSSGRLEVAFAWSGWNKIKDREEVLSTTTSIPKQPSNFKTQSFAKLKNWLQKNLVIMRVSFCETMPLFLENARNLGDFRYPPTPNGSLPFAPVRTQGAQESNFPATRHRPQLGIENLIDTFAWFTCVNIRYVHPEKLTWQWKTDHLKMYLLLKMGISHCHVSFREGMYKDNLCLHLCIHKYETFCLINSMNKNKHVSIVCPT